MNDLTPTEISELDELIEEYDDIFALNNKELSHTDIVQHTINTGDSPPLRQPAQRIPFSLRAKVEEMVKEMEEQGVVQPSASRWASPIVLVTMKDGSTRSCVDCRCLNAVTKKDVYALPIDDTLDSLAKQK